MKAVLVAVTLVHSTAGFSTPLKTTNLQTLPTFNAVTSQRLPRAASSALSSTISNDGDMLPGISAIQEANAQLSEQLGGLRESPYFRLYCVDILASCEYMPQELFECYSETCEVYPTDDEVVRKRF